MRANSDKLQTFPLGMNVLFAVTLHDNIGRTFAVASIPLKYRLNRQVTFKCIVMLMLLISGRYIITDISRVRMGPGNHGKSWNFTLAFSRTGKSRKMTTSPGKSWRSVNSNNKVLDFCLVRVYCFEHMIFAVSIACGTKCKTYSKNKVIVDVAAGQINCRLGSPGKIYLSPGKVLEICF